MWAGKLAQTTLARRAGPLSFISVRSKKRARIRSSPARITSPTRKVPQPGPGKGANNRLATAITIHGVGGDLPAPVIVLLSEKLPAT